MLLAMLSIIMSRSDDVPPPQQIVRGVFLGSIDDATYIPKLKRLHIGALLNVADFDLKHRHMYKAHMPRLLYAGIPMDDSPDFPIESFFDITNELIHSARMRGLRVLVHCYAGVSRSVTVLAAYLMATNGWTLETTMRRIRRLRPQAQPNPGFMRALHRYEHRLARHNRLR
jgi:dual specificity protein phosphatase 1B